jgi:hypothetical protein
VETDEVWDFKLTTYDGVVHSCSELMNEDVSFQGAITASTGPTSYTTDSCPPGVNCMPALNTLEVTSSTLELAIPVGTVVNVSAHFSWLGGRCTAGLFVKNVPLWGGQPNPTSSDEAPWLDSGGPGSPFDVKTSVRCTYGEGGDPPCTGGTSVYDLSFALAGDPSISTGPVATGTTLTLEVPSGSLAGRYAVRNVRANSGYCEVPGTVEYFIARDSLP